MKISMMYFDNNPKSTLDAKVQGAAEYYRQKHSLTPTECWINPAMFPNTAGEVYHVGSIEVRKSRQVLPNHFWIGVADAVQHAATLS